MDPFHYNVMGGCKYMDPFHYSVMGGGQICAMHSFPLQCHGRGEGGGGGEVGTNGKST